MGRKTRKRVRGETYEELLDSPALYNLTVYEKEEEPVDTGLLDHDGRPLFKTERKNKIGFLTKGKRRKEKSASRGRRGKGKGNS